MDVRCEKCHTEYELEDAKVTEAGVTVKCTSCGNLFKIRRRASATVARVNDAGNDATGMWSVRSPGGELRRFRELTTLQQWIVERKVTRECEISRSGETWKRLGDIAELSAFFAIVDQAQNAARPAPAATASPPVERKTTQPLAPATVGPARGPSIPTLPLPAPLAAAEPKRAELSATATLPGRASAGSPLEPEPQPAPRTARRQSWAGAAVTGPSDDAAGSSRPPSQEPAWTRNDRKDIPLPTDPVDAPSFETGGEEVGKRTVKVEPRPFGDFSDFDAFVPRRQSWTWLYVTAIVVAGAVVLGYFALRPKPTPEPVTSAVPKPPAVSSTAPADAGPAVDAATQAYRDGLAAFYQDTDESFAAAEKKLEQARVGLAEQDARVIAAQALVSSTISQYLLDDAKLATDSKVAAQLRAEAGRRLARAAKLVKEAEGKAPKEPEVLISAADVMRLQKKPAAAIEKRLEGAGDSSEVLYERGMLRWRDGKNAEAEDLLTRAIAERAKEGGEHLRAHYRLATIAIAAGKPDAAKVHIEAILAAQPKHARAKALAARLAKPPAAPPAAVGKPVAETGKRGEKEAEKEKEKEKPSPAAELGSGPISASAYGHLVERGDKLAENGECSTAMRYYDRALDARPGGVEALTGLGYCYLDRKEYERAISSFRAALGISSRYQEALIGIAEAYRFQGKSRDALAYYQRYLEQAPDGPKAGMARRYVESLAPKPSAPAPVATPPPPVPTPSPTAPVTETQPVEAPPIDKLPNKPGAVPAPSPKPAPESTPQSTPPAATPVAPPVDALPVKPQQPKSEPAPEPPPPAPPPSNPAAPDSPKVQ